MDSNAQSIAKQRPNTSTVVKAKPKRVSQLLYANQIFRDRISQILAHFLNYTETREQSLTIEDNVSALESNGIFENMSRLTRERVNGVASDVTGEVVDDVSIRVTANESAHQPNESPLETPPETCAQYLRGAEELSRRFFGMNHTADQLMALLKYALISYCLGDVDMALQKIIDASREIGLAALHNVQYPIPVSAVGLSVGRESVDSLGGTSRAPNVVPYNPVLDFGANNSRQHN